MAAPKFLAPGEHVVFHVRAHWKGLIVPVLALLAIGALVWLGLVELVPDPQTQAVWRWVIVAAGVILAVVFFLVPFLRWLTTTDTLTTKRLISREGIVTRSGRDIPIDRVNAVNYERTLVDRVFGCGTLVVQTAGTESDVELHDVAHIERRLIQIQQILVDEQTEEDRRVRAIVAEETRHARSSADRAPEDDAARAAATPSPAPEKTDAAPVKASPAEKVSEPVGTSAEDAPTGTPADEDTHADDEPRA